MMNNLLPPLEPKNAEGYCPECGNALDISGICYVCAERDIDEIKLRLQDVFVCKICGQPKYHSLLYGYQCHNPEHNR